MTTRLERARVLLGGGVAEYDEHINEQDSEPNESWAELLEAVAAVDLTLCPSCGAHAVQRGPLPSLQPPVARAPPEAAA